MSLRPALYAIDLQRFREALTADRSVTLRSAARHLLALDCGLDQADVRRAADELLSGGFDGRTELDTHVYAIVTIAQALGFQSEASEIHFGDWPIGAYHEYLDLLAPVLPAVSREIYAHFLAGRPLIGDGIDTEWSYYSFLWAQEVRHLLSDLSQIHAMTPALNTKECIHGFPNEFRGWLNEVVRRSADLWVFAE